MYRSAWRNIFPVDTIPWPVSVLRHPPTIWTKWVSLKVSTYIHNNINTYIHILHNDLHTCTFIHTYRLRKISNYSMCLYNLYCVYRFQYVSFLWSVCMYVCSGIVCAAAIWGGSGRLRPRGSLPSHCRTNSTVQWHLHLHIHTHTHTYIHTYCIYMRKQGRWSGWQWLQ